MRKSLAIKSSLVFIIAFCLTFHNLGVDADFLQLKARVEIATSLFIDAEPNSVAVYVDTSGKFDFVPSAVKIKIRIEPAPPAIKDRFQGISVRVISPNGSVRHTFNAVFGEGNEEEFWVNNYIDMVGKCTVQASFAGQNFANGDIYYLPSENQVTLTVLPPPWSNVGSWVSKAPLHQARSGLGVAAVNGKIYAIGGSTASGFVTSSPPQLIITNKAFVDGFVGTNEEYDPTTDTWTYKASMPTPRIGFATAVYQNKIYCIGGKTSSGSYTGVNEVYDPATNTWQTKMPMPTAKGWVTANVIGEKIYVIGGGVYDPATDTWASNEPIMVYDGYVSTSLDNKIYIIGGSSEDSYHNLNLIYDTETDKWDSGSYPPSSVAAGAAIATTGVSAPKRVYVLGVPSSLRQSEPDSFVRIYDPANDNWTLGANPEHSYLFNFGVAVINDTLYSIGGLTYNGLEYKASDANQQYTPPSAGAIDAESPVNTPEPTSLPFPTDWLIAGAVITVAVAGARLIIYFKKRKKQA